MNKERPRVHIRFKYNIDTGEIEDFIIDDNAPTASEDYHDKVAQAISSLLSRRSDIQDVALPPTPAVLVITSGDLEAQQHTQRIVEDEAAN